MKKEELRHKTTDNLRRKDERAEEYMAEETARIFNEAEEHLREAAENCLFETVVYTVSG